MISSLTGVVSEITGSTLELMVQGVGYEVHVPTSLTSSARSGDQMRVFVHTAVREDSITLFGFGDSEQRRSFRELIGVTGVGPKLALAILSTFTVDALRKAIAGSDVDVLTTIPGVGKRSAQRIVLELKDKVGMSTEVIDPTGALAEAREALTGLGYSPAEVRDVLEKVPSVTHEDVETLIKAALKELARV